MLLVLFLLVLFSNQTVSNPIHDVLDSVVTVQTHKKYGLGHTNITGLFIDDNHIVMTYNQINELNRYYDWPLHVIFNDHEVREVKLVGHSHRMGIAVLKLIDENSKNVSYARWVDQYPTIGDTVYVASSITKIENRILFDQDLSIGTVSSVSSHSPYNDGFFKNIKINAPHFRAGVIFNESGEVIGISDPYTVNQFVIPFDIVKHVALEIIDKGYYDCNMFGAFFSDNVNLNEIPAEYMLYDQYMNHTQVIHVMPYSPAYNAGIKVGDIVTHVNGTEVFGKGSLEIYHSMHFLDSLKLVNIDIIRNHDTDLITVDHSRGFEYPHETLNLNVEIFKRSDYLRVDQYDMYFRKIHSDIVFCGYGEEYVSERLLEEGDIVYYDFDQPVRNISELKKIFAAYDPVFFYKRGDTVYRHDIFLLTY